MIRKKSPSDHVKKKSKHLAPKKATTLKKASGKKLTGKAKKKTSVRASGKDLKKAAPAKAVKAKAKSKASVSYKINEGDAAPLFDLPATGGINISSRSLKGKKYVLYFYPKDNTPGCTLEGYDFKKLHKQFQNANCEILGVSKDSLKSHEGFRSKCGFPFELLSDEEGSLCRAFDVIQMKSLYGRKFEGIERSTFVVDENGKILAAWRKVKVEGHADEVLKAIKN